ncbi:MAG: ATP-binding cassette domain-containing protein [Bacteroidota bacterium]
MENVIEIQGLKKSFGGHEVLKNITLNVEKGKSIVVLGKSGQGKSVMIKCVVGMMIPDEGSLKVFGNEVAEMNEDELREMRTKIGFLFQGGALYDSMTVRENLAFALTRVLKIKDDADIEKRAVEALDAVGLGEAIDKMPSDLSGGMRKRMAFARTLIVKPEIILYDEPTTGLDTITSKEISRLMLDIQKKYKTSSIIITHDMQCAKITADRIVVLNEGELIAEGTYSELENCDNDFVQQFFK